MYKNGYLPKVPKLNKLYHNQYSASNTYILLCTFIMIGRFFILGSIKKIILGMYYVTLNSLVFITSYKTKQNK